MDNLINILQDIKSILYHINCNRPDSMPIKKADILYKLNVLIKYYNEQLSINEFLQQNISDDIYTGNYLAGSRQSAIDKAREVIRFLSDSKHELSNIGFINLGGGDGTELFYELENTKAIFGLLVEYDFYAIQQFREKVLNFRYKMRDKKVELIGIEADLLDDGKLKIVKDVVTKKHLNGVVITIHAVLHELKNRSNFKFDLNEFFQNVFDIHKNTILIIREPGTSSEWPIMVKIKINRKYKADFEAILKNVKLIHFRDRKYKYTIHDKYINCHRDLAIESLFKIFYRKDYEYEIIEKVTSVKIKSFKQAIKNAGFDVKKTMIFDTKSIEKLFKKYKIEVYHQNNSMLKLPGCFNYIIATKGKI